MTLLILLASIATALTFGMFHSRNVMLGFPCGIFWFLSGGQAYELYATAWDIYYDLFFACFGMGIWSIYAAFAVRRRDLNPTERDWMDSEEFLDEGRKKRDTENIAVKINDAIKEWESYHPEERISLKRQGIRDRAKKRRGGY